MRMLLVVAPMFSAVMYLVGLDTQDDTASGVSLLFKSGETLPSWAFGNAATTIATGTVWSAILLYICVAKLPAPRNMQSHWFWFPIGICVGIGSLMGLTVGMSKGWYSSLEAFALGCVAGLGVMAFMGVASCVVALCDSVIVPAISKARERNNVHAPALLKKVGSWFSAEDFVEEPKQKA